MLNDTKKLKTKLVGCKVDEEFARRFKRASGADGGVSKVLRRLMKNYLQRRRAA